MELVILALTAIGYFCAGYLWAYVRGHNSTLAWRIRWIELEHDSARKEGREPRKIDTIA